LNGSSNTACRHRHLGKGRVPPRVGRVRKANAATRPCTHRKSHAATIHLYSGEKTGKLGRGARVLSSMIVRPRTPPGVGKAMEVDSRPCCQRWVIARPITAWLRQLDPFRGFARMDLRTRRLAIASWENRTSGRAQGQPDKIATAGTARAPIASRERRLSTSVKREGVSSPNYLLRALGESRVPGNRLHSNR